jgi:NAD(P) transhydrogenase subunit alpha
MIVGVIRESFPGERRVAVVPASAPALAKAGLALHVQSGAGVAAGFADEAYRAAGATVVPGPDAVFEAAQIVCQVRAGAIPGGARHTQIALCDPFDDAAATTALARSGARVLALELLPRITRAQAMDVLSSQATIAGYEAVVVAAAALPRIFPMMMTAAGTIAPARVLVIGAGVAGLQAIATARRMGGVVSGYDVRAAVKDQVESLGARFLQIEIDSSGAEGEGGYAKAMGEAFYQAQRAMMAKAVAEQDVVITTAAIPGQRAPVLVTAEMVGSMSAGSVIVDLAAARGGNCELTRPDETVVASGVTILGPTNLASAAPFHASQMFSRNLTNLLCHLVKDGAFKLDREDEILAGMLLAEGGRVVHAKVREALSLKEAG